MSAYLSPDSPHHKELSPRSYSVVTEKEFGKDHTVFDGAPCEWSKARGATHTLFWMVPVKVRVPPSLRKPLWLSAPMKLIIALNGKNGI